MTPTISSGNPEGPKGQPPGPVGLRRKSYVSALPEPVRLEINCKLRDGWRHDAIAEWLLTQTADRDIPEHLLKKGDRYALIWLRRGCEERVIQENCRTVISRWSRGPYQDWLAQQPKPFVPPSAPKAINVAFRALAEEIKDNHKAMNLLERLRRAVRRAMQRQREEANAMPWRR